MEGKGEGQERKGKGKGCGGRDFVWRPLCILTVDDDIILFLLH